MSYSYGRALQQSALKFWSKDIQDIEGTQKVFNQIYDDVYLAKKLKSDGCHLGQKDMSVSQARRLIGNKIIELLVITP